MINEVILALFALVKLERNKASTNIYRFSMLQNIFMNLLIFMSIKKYLTHMVYNLHTINEQEEPRLLKLFILYLTKQ